MRSLKAARILSLCINITIVLMEIRALLLNIQSHKGAVFLYYTEDSNFFAGIMCLIMAAVQIRSLAASDRNALIPDWVSALYYIAVSLLSVTFMVVVLVLAPMSGGLEGYRLMLLEGSALYQHLLCPLLMFVSFILLGHEVNIRRSTTALALIPTILYAVITISLNAAKIVEGPYPFLRVYEQPVWVSVIWFLAIMGGAYVFAYGIWRMNQFIHKKCAVGC